VNRHVAGNRGEIAAQRRKVVRDIALVEDDDGSDAARKRRGEIALHARRRKVAPGRRHDEDDVEVRGNDLRSVPAVGTNAGEHAATRRDRFDAAVRVERDVVADGGPFE
jgi:hypothetical protein